MNKTEQLDFILKEMRNWGHFADPLTLREWADKIEAIVRPARKAVRHLKEDKLVSMTEFRRVANEIEI